MVVDLYDVRAQLVAVARDHRLLAGTVHVAARPEAGIAERQAHRQ